jgi:hypothetical protein
VTETASIRQKRVAREHGRRFVERLVGGGPAAAQIVIVHAGKIVMHERVSVHGLDRGRCARRKFGFHIEQARALQYEKRPEPLAAREDRITSRFVNARMQAAGPGQDALENLFCNFGRT